MNTHHRSKIQVIVKQLDQFTKLDKKGKVRWARRRILLNHKKFLNLIIELVKLLANAGVIRKG